MKERGVVTSKQHESLRTEARCTVLQLDAYDVCLTVSTAQRELFAIEHSRAAKSEVAHKQSYNFHSVTPYTDVRLTLPTLGQATLSTRNQEQAENNWLEVRLGND